MSLQSFLSIREINSRFKKEFNKPELNLNEKLRVPCHNQDQKLTLIAFKYLMSFELERINPQGYSSDWTAEMARDMAKIRGSEDFAKKATLIIEKTKRNLLKYKNDAETEYTEKEDMVDSLVESAWKLAQLDFSFYEGDERVIIPSSDDLQELKSLMNIIHYSDFQSEFQCYWGPSLGEASRLVGGASMDLVLDDMIIQINLSDKLELLDNDFHVLCGLYTLCNLGRIKHINTSKISKLGIYFARFGVLYKMDVDDTIDSHKFGQFVEWFEEKACDYFA